MYKIYGKYSEAMTSSTRSFAYSYQSFQEMFHENCPKLQSVITSLFFQPNFIQVFTVLCEFFVTLSSEIKLNLVPDFPFKGIVQYWCPNMKSSSNLMVTGCLWNETTMNSLTNYWTNLFCLLTILQSVENLMKYLYNQLKYNWFIQVYM